MTPAQGPSKKPTLPKAPPLAAEPTPRRRRPSRRPGRPSTSWLPRLDGLLVLIVEDDADSRELSRTMLERHGATVFLTETAFQALRLLETMQPDVVVADLRMPRMDGFEFVREIRTERRWTRLPVIALTALGTDEDYLGTLSSGFDAHLTKPVDDVVLASTVLRVARRRPE